MYMQIHMMLHVFRHLNLFLLNSTRYMYGPIMHVLSAKMREIGSLRCKYCTTGYFMEIDP